MRIGVIGGTGALGGALAGWWAQAGHEVLVSELGAGPGAGVVPAGRRGLRTGTVLEAAGFGDAVLFAPDWDVAHDVLDRTSAALAGKPVLDATNPGPAPVVRGSGMGQLAEWSPEVHWVKAFNTLPVEVLDARRGRDPLLAEFLCTDHPDARRAASELVRDAGLAPMFAGGADAAWVTETGPLQMREVDIADATALLAVALEAPH